MVMQVPKYKGKEKKKKKKQSLWCPPNIRPFSRLPCLPDCLPAVLAIRSPPPKLLAET